MASELRDRFGPLPESAANMLRIVELKARAAAAGIDRVEIDRSLTLKASFSSDRLPDKKQIAVDRRSLSGPADLSYEGGVRDDREGSSRAAGRQARHACCDLENLLKSLEFSDK